MEEKKCQGCGKLTPQDELRFIQIKTCCSTQNIPLCPSCWDKQHGKKQQD